MRSEERTSYIKSPGSQTMMASLQSPFQQKKVLRGTQPVDTHRSPCMVSNKVSVYNSA